MRKTWYGVPEMSRLCGKRPTGCTTGGRGTPEIISRVAYPPLRNLNIENKSNKDSKFGTEGIRTVLSFEERMRRYTEARNRIFQQHQLAGMRQISTKVKKARQRFGQRRGRRREVAAAVLRNDANDPRPFAKISVHGEHIIGLLDTVATISLLGHGSRELMQKLEMPIGRYFSKVRTAAGEDRSIIGRTELPVKYNGRVKTITFYICPYLEQKAYFGVDFWHAFELAPEVIGPDGNPKEENAVAELRAHDMTHYAEDSADE
jgi:hypothetical protein